MTCDTAVNATWTCLCDGSLLPCGWENNEPLQLPPSAYEPYGPNGVRQMGGDHAGVHKGQLVCMCVHMIGRTCVCWFVFEFLDKIVEGWVCCWTLHTFPVGTFPPPNEIDDVGHIILISPQLAEGCSPDTPILCTWMHHIGAWKDWARLLGVLLWPLCLPPVSGHCTVLMIALFGPPSSMPVGDCRKGA